MSQYEDQEEVQTKEWEEALSIIENIFKDYKDNGSPNKTVPKVDSLALDVARWKVVWGKKPAQYRLKPFLIWSVDEMPSIPEECESFPEHVDNAKEPVDTLKIRNDKKLRLMRKKIFKMNRRIDEINVLLIHAAEDAKRHATDEDGNDTGSILTEATRAELTIERNVILDKLRKTKKKLILLKNAGVEQKKLAVIDQDDSRDMLRADASGDNRSGLTLSFDQEDSDTLNFKHGRRAAIKKEIRSNVWTKMVNSPLQENSQRRSESFDPEDKKNKKKKFCRKHHRKIHDKSSVQGCENEMLLGRRALSENDFTRVVKELNERGQQNFETFEGGERDKMTKSARIGESRNDSILENIGAVGSCTDSRGNGLHKSSQQGCQTELVTGLVRPQRSKKSESGTTNAKSDSPGSPSSSACTSGPVNSNQSKTRKNKILRVTTDGVGDTLDMKRSSEPGKLPKVKKCPPSTAKETRPKPQTRFKPENKELTTRVRSQKIAEAAAKIET